MTKHMNILKKCILFKGISEQNITKLLQCLTPLTKSYLKGMTVFYSGDRTESLAVLLSGRVQLYTDDVFGNRSIITDILPGDLFAEAVPFTNSQVLPASSEVIQDSEIMFLHNKKLLYTCSSCCGFHEDLLKNLVTTIAEKNIILNKKTEHISKRSTKDKLLSYLYDCQKKNNSKQFCIPFDRQQLADYLCVDRSALSAQLSSLKQQKILDFSKNNFTLLV